MDFNNESTISLDKQDINVITLIESHYYIIQALEEYFKQSYNNMEPVSRMALMSRIDTLYYLLRPALKIFWKQKKGEEDKLLEIKEQITSNNLDPKLTAFENMQDLLFDKGVLRFGKVKTINTAIAEEEDASKGL
jgi:hypothetical protein